uniref:Cyanocobalamin reductase (cyanide-eliminating) n=1 Tax=Chromera velia CCMP2878 TaxID=1169474 RepID=A0A0G4HDZ0_9ALVE|mmetsp:Transcript_7963/g.15527  ORF Transcript_7963/g.15527 Transcript_7963/m.15527 type:complete len:291 (-) Transcript_7963:142-1014(-)|eukprot:Cvel_26535.t1-p1 / transcript=Cvel_26535.t1 / gene=Cvel_26535 / organism=Chromera_velia_CCMP2878 / gene_product=Methylmalonic aciduria and homocystinuria type C, putative / transcript_product=Methylmalonic aciduria and homocystinuria type C, putative / location=Cvel_scaffold3172:13609-16548(+) / protein_length=290 / sequence_SO=supercontig / SO=protein_coding / is_pseudo=false
MPSCDVKELSTKLEQRLAEVDLHCNPFLVKWYNDLRMQVAPANPQLIESAPEDSVAFLILAGPSNFESVVSYWNQKGWQKGMKMNFVDDAVTEMVTSRVEATMETIPFFRDNSSEKHPWRLQNLDEPPYLHSQTVGTVTGVTQHLEPKDVGDDEWVRELEDEIKAQRSETDFLSSKAFGLSVHPQMGGWFVFRFVLFFPSVRLSGEEGSEGASLRLPPPLSFLSIEEKKRLLEEYNLRPNESYWRDLHGPEGEPLESCRAYSAEAYLYFHTRQPGVRKRFLELKRRQMAA